MDVTYLNTHTHTHIHYRSTLQLMAQTGSAAVLLVCGGVCRCVCRAAGSQAALRADPLYILNTHPPFAESFSDSASVSHSSGSQQSTAQEAAGSDPNQDPAENSLGLTS